MLTNQCNIFLDEALTAIDNNSKLSVEATAHLETCIECRRSLESIKALKASTATVLPIAAFSLKSKIASHLEGAIKARSVTSVGNKLVKTTLATGSVLLGLAGIITCGVIGLSSPNKSEIPMDNSKQNYNSSISVTQVATITTNINKSDTTKDESTVNSENIMGDNSDLRTKESLEEHTKAFYPSVIVDKE
jgi:hypothetical protein